MEEEAAAKELLWIKQTWANLVVNLRLGIAASAERPDNVSC